MQRGHLSEILLNLLQNAREVLGDKGNIYVAADCQRDYAVEISVRDDGAGIPPEKMERSSRRIIPRRKKAAASAWLSSNINAELYGGNRARGIGAWKRREIHRNLSGEGIDDIFQMNPPLPPVLVVDDEKNMRLSLQTVLKDEVTARAPLNPPRKRSSFWPGGVLHGHHRCAARRHERL